LLIALLLPLFLPLVIPVAHAQTENNVFADNFESYQVGSFPSAGGWEIVWDGMGQSYQVISTSYSYSPTRSFQLWGRTGWSAVVQKRFSADSPIIGYELSILIDERGSGYTDHPAFFCKDCATWGAYYGTVNFDHGDGKIKAEDGTVLGSWSPRTWYRVKVVLDRQTNKYSVWINGELRGQNIPTSRSDTNRINAIALVSGWPGKKVYYDDVRVFIVVQQQFVVEIVSYNAPSTASPGQTVSVQITIRYSFPSTSQVGIGVGRQLPDGSWEGVWYNPDYRTQRSGQGTLTYTATFAVPNQPGTYRYGIFAQYWNGSRWIITDSKYFNIQVQQQQQLSVDVWTNKGGQGRGNFNGGQYTIGESITFYCSVNLNVDSLRIKVIRPDGVEVIALDRGPSSAGTYQASGTVGEPAGERKVICEASSGGQTSSDEVRFTVTQPPDTVPPTVRVIAPNGGETLFPGNVFRIRWEASDNVGVAKVHIWLFQGNEQVMVIARDLPNTGYYDWTVPDRPGTGYRIRIAAVDAAGNAGYDDSDGTFAIGRATAQIVSLSTDKSQYNRGETVRIRYTIRNTGDVRIELRMVVEIVDPSGRSVYDSHRLDQDRRHDLDPGQTASGEFMWTIPADAVLGTYEVRASLRHWNVWDKIFDYRWGDRPGPRFTVQAGVQGTLQHFDLDYHGTPPNSDGNDQTTVTVSPCSRLTLFFYYREGNAGNNYIIRVYAEWDKNNFIANSDGNEAYPENTGQEVGGFRWDVEDYTVPCTPGTYKVRVVYRASTTPPTWDSYDRLLAEGTVIVQAAATATLQVGIRHTYIGDLKIWVGVEGGREVLIWNREGGGTHDLFREWDLLQLGFTVNDLPPSESKRWYLRIRDEAGGDEGRLEYFRIIYQGQTYESQDHPEIKDYQEIRAWIPSRGVPSGEFVIKGSATFLNSEPMKGGYIIVELIFSSIEKYVLSVGEVGENGEFVVKFPTSYGIHDIEKVKVTPYYRGIYFSSTSREIRLRDYPDSTATLNFRVPYIGSPGLMASKAFIKDDRGEDIIVVEVEPRTISKNKFTILNFYIYLMPKHIYNITLTTAILNVFFREDILVDKFGPEPKPGKFAFISIASEPGWYAYSPPPPPRNFIEQILNFFINLIGPAVSELIGLFIPGFGLLQAILERYMPEYIFGSGPPQLVINLDPNDWDTWQASWDEHGTSLLPGLQGWLGAKVEFKIRGPIERAVDIEEAYFYLKILVKRQRGPLILGWVSLEQKIILQVSE
jgi:subtilisin-like proprotein convertase family protein